MDDRSLEKWSDTLDALREIRQASLDSQVAENGSSFSPSQFSELAMGSLDEAISKWWNIAEQSWQDSPPENESEALEDFKGEMDSIFDFELEALERDLTDTREKVSWSETDCETEFNNISKFADNLRKNFSIKIDSLANGRGRKKKPVAPDPMPRTVAPRSVGSGSSGGGSGVFIMFIVGILLGGGPAIYFWDAANKLETEHQSEISKIRNELRAIQNDADLLQETFAQLARGKIRNVPQIEAAIKPIKASIARERENVDKTFLVKRENLLKKVPAGDRLDRSLEKLEIEKRERMEIIDAIEKRKLKPLIKELQTIKEMMGE